MIMELVGSMDVIRGRMLAQKLGKSQPIFFQALTTNLTQHDSHGPDDQLKTIIDYHHLSMSRDDGINMSMELVGSMDVIW
jgi:hypothetical protein